MCLILYATTPEAQNAIRGRYLASAWSQNADGAGIAVRYSPTGPVTVHKGLVTLPDLMKAWVRIRSLKPSEVAIHLRYTTSGDNSPSNTHPHRLQCGALLHNGILSTLPTVTESDTARFARLVYQLPTHKIVELLEAHRIRQGSRILIMAHQRENNVVLGDWHEGRAPGLMLSQGYSVPALLAKKEAYVPYGLPTRYTSEVDEGDITTPASDDMPEGNDPDAEFGQVEVDSGLTGILETFRKHGHHTTPVVSSEGAP